MTIPNEGKFMLAAKSRDQATIRALRDIDPDLAGLFEWGRELCAEPDRPGLAYLIGHVGRELTNCLVSQLVGESFDSAESTVGEGSGKENRRFRIASALGLSPDHEVVRRWFKVHQTLQSATHARVPGPKIAPLRPAFAELADLLYGRIGDYFQTEADVDAMADSTNPASVPPEQLRHLLVRPVQRQRFFSRIQGKEWIEPLRRAGFFSTPPGREIFADGSWRPRPWPEGRYLIRMAVVEPKLVADVLLSLPDSNENPNVWFAVAEAIEALPANDAIRLVPKLVRALETSFIRVFTHRVVAAARSLALRHRPEAFGLVEALLTVSPAPSNADLCIETPPPGYVESLRQRREALTWSDKWILARIDEYDYEQLSQLVFPELRKIDPRRLLEVLASRTDAASRVVPRAQRAFDDAIKNLSDAARGPADDIEQFESGHDINSRLWCKHLGHVGDGRSVRAQLVIDTYETAKHLAMNGFPVAALIRHLDRRPNEIFIRMKYALLADTITLDAELKVNVDNFLASDDAIDPTFGGTESAALLRAHFVDASVSAQQVFVKRIERGPDGEYVARMVEFWEREDTVDARERIVADWQRKRLRWFHERIPPVLLPIADRLEVGPAKPSAEQQSLDETGSWSSGVVSRGHRSPVAWQDLATMSQSEFVDYLNTWRPTPPTDSPFDGLSLEGLAGEVAELATQSPEIVERLLSPDASEAIPLRFLAAILRGLRSGIVQKKTCSFGLILSVASHAWRKAERTDDENPDEGYESEGAANAVCDVIAQFIGNGKPTETDRETLWPFLSLLLESSLTWRDPPNGVAISTYGEARNASFTRLSAKVTETILAAAWNEYIEHNASATWPPPKSTSIAELTTPMLDRIISVRSPSGYAAQGVLGQYLVQLLWFAHEWTLSHLTNLLDDGSAQPLEHPAWSVYLDSSRLSPEVFPLLRLWYGAHAAFLPSDGSDPVQDPGSGLAQHFAEHVIFACVTGKCSPGDGDRVVENTFSRVPIAARNHAYWSVFRSWSDAKNPSQTYSANVIRLWESRIQALELSRQDSSRDEELDGLCWFLATPHLPTREVLRLGLRTTTMLSRKLRLTGIAWERLSKLSATDAEGTFAIVEQLIDRILNDDFRYLSFDEVAPSLRQATAAGGELRDRAIALVHRIGDAGFDEFGILWRETQVTK